MTHTNRVCDECLEELRLAGEKAPPGVYREIVTRREVRLDTADLLPASLDGRVACYVRVDDRRWGAQP